MRYRRRRTGFRRSRGWGKRETGCRSRVKIDAKGGSLVACCGRASLRRERLEGDGVPELLELADESSRSLFGGATAVEVVGTEFLVGDLLFEEVVGGDQDRVAEGAGCLAGAAAAAQAPVLGAEVGALAARSRLGRLGEGLVQPFGALARLARVALAGGFVVARTLPGPGGEVCVAGEDAHVDA